MKYLNQANNPTRQRGMSLITVSIILAVAIFFGMFGFKVGPSYAEYWTISRVADGVAEDADLLQGPKNKVWDKVRVGFSQNNLWDAKPKEHMRLEKDGNRGTILMVDYERRVNLFANIFIVTKFEKEAGTGQP